MAVSTGATQKKFSEALGALIEQVKADRSVLAAILCGSLSHDTVWEKSDIDLVLVTIDGIPWQMNFIDAASGRHQGIVTLAISADGTPEWLFVNSSGQTVGQTPLQV